MSWNGSTFIGTCGGIRVNRSVLVCDDQEVFIEDFKRRHGQHYRILVENDIGELVDRLHNMKRLPDLLLLDLYHPETKGEGSSKGG